MKIRAIGSGSKGNCYLVRGGGKLLLVDCGLSCLELTKRMKACGLDPTEIAGVFFTHDHVDHYRGLETFHKKYPSVPLYANGNTADAIAAVTGVEDGWCVFETTEPFEVGGLSVNTFSTPHDAADSVGYVFEEAEGESVLFIGTDMGVMTVAAKEALARCTCAVLESNHDSVLLQTSERPLSLKQRIAGRCGHLSNDQAADAVREMQPSRLRTLLLAHLSQECNADYLARESMERALKEIGRTDVQLAVLTQEEPSDCYEF
ncbi:MAG: MBL fold metallo-hydrolase [Kiritimatiellae bacterium]|nr:MBL fold metallo-hydrolase [Kiritimatiellia bacterium]